MHSLTFAKRAAQLVRAVNDVTAQWKPWVHCPKAVALLTAVEQFNLVANTEFSALESDTYHDTLNQNSFTFDQFDQYEEISTDLEQENAAGE
jgi:hypothetical protein